MDPNTSYGATDALFRIAHGTSLKANKLGYFILTVELRVDKSTLPDDYAGHPQGPGDAK